MFERFTERARQVVVLAQEESRKLNHTYIGTEHILLGLLREEEGLGARALEDHGMDYGQVFAQVSRSAINDEYRGQIPFTPVSKLALENATREALVLGHNYVGTEHVLLGLVRDHQGVVSKILKSFNVSPEAIRQHVINLLKAPFDGRTPRAMLEDTIRKLERHQQELESTARSITWQILELKEVRDFFPAKSELEEEQLAALELDEETLERLRRESHERDKRMLSSRDDDESEGEEEDPSDEE